MPFTRTTTEPSTTPLVTVKFAGLMLLEDGAGDTCAIGIHRWAPQHSFQVMLIVNKPQRPPTVIRLRSGPLEGPFVIRLDPVKSADFKAYAANGAQLDAEGDLLRNVHNATNYPLDYRWRLNLRKLHPNAQRNEGANPIVQLETGVLYTPNLTPVNLDPKLVKENGETQPLYRFAADLAAAIQPPANTTVQLEWRELGQLQVQPLPRSRNLDPAGTTYTVAFLNDPPLSAPKSHDEIAEYYKILTVGGDLIPPEHRWELTYATNVRTDEIPCMPGTLEP